METGQDKKYIEGMLFEAMELLAELRPGMAMFRRQYYCKLKGRFDQHQALSKALQDALNNVETES